MNVQEILAQHALWVRGYSRDARADLRGADLRGADLRWADLRWANPSGANLSGAKHNGRTGWPDGFDVTREVAS